MKFLIWTAVIFVASLIVVTTGIKSGIGYFLIVAAAFIFASYVCRVWDKSREEDRQKQEMKTQSSGENEMINDRSNGAFEKKVKEAFESYDGLAAKNVFIDGKKSARDIIESLAVIYGLNLDECDSYKYTQILNTYSDTVIRLRLGNSYDSIAKSLRVNHSDLVDSQEIAEKVLGYVIFNLKNPEFKLDNETSIALVNASVGMTDKVNIIDETKYLNDPEYGLVPEKPIYTNGRDGSSQYLSSLCSIDGKPLQWNRRGSIYSEDNIGLVDIYDCYRESGDQYITIYINMYGNHNSTVIPKGFIHLSNVPVKEETSATVKKNVSDDSPIATKQATPLTKSSPASMSDSALNNKTKETAAKWKRLSFALASLLFAAIIAIAVLAPDYANYQTIKNFSKVSFGESKTADYFAIPDIVYLTNDAPEKTISCYVDDNVEPEVECESGRVTVSLGRVDHDGDMNVTLRKSKNGIAMVHFKDSNNPNISFYVLAICK